MDSHFIRFKWSPFQGQRGTAVEAWTTWGQSCDMLQGQLLSGVDLNLRKCKNNTEPGLGAWSETNRNKERRPTATGQWGKLYTFENQDTFCTFTITKTVKSAPCQEYYHLPLVERAYYFSWPFSKTYPLWNFTNVVATQELGQADVYS